MENGVRILIVDDHPSFRRCARALLEADGFAVIGEAEDGEGALSAIGSLRPDVVLLDVQLPDMDGFAVLEQLGTDAVIAGGEGSPPAREADVVAWPAFRDAVLDTREFIQTQQRVPARVFIGAEAVSPADFLVGLAFRSCDRLHVRPRGGEQSQETCGYPVAERQGYILRRPAATMWRRRDYAGK